MQLQLYLGRFFEGKILETWYSFEYGYNWRLQILTSRLTSVLTSLILRINSNIIVELLSDVYSRKDVQMVHFHIDLWHFQE